MGKLPRPQEVRIAGAGLSGLSASIALARAGVAVEVHERGTGPGCRHHFDLQGIENWFGETNVLERLRKVGLSLDCPLYPIHEVHLMGDDLQELVVRTDEPLAYLVQRGFGPATLDDSLRRQAESLGVSIYCQSRLEPGEAQIWATGPPSAVGIVAGYTFKTDHPLMVLCLLHEEYAPGGYVYLNIAGGEGTLATVLVHSFEKARRCLEMSCQLLTSRFALRMEKAKPFGGIGHFRLPWQVKGQSLTVGEAGGFQDLLFGFGIHMALTTGHLAARSLLEGASYEKLWRAEFYDPLRAGLSNRLLFELAGSLGHRYMIRQARRLGPQVFLKRWYRFNALKAGAYPLARLWSRFRFKPASG